jgi:GMP synthase PP-ATPase subunit
MAKKSRSEATELFVSPEDIVKAHQIVDEIFGGEVDVNYAGMPKNVGQMGDEGYRGHSVVISAGSEAVKQTMLADEGTSLREGYSDLDEASRRITNETHGATRVLLDITPGGGHFKIDKNNQA